jgi:hypothetical protein
MPTMTMRADVNVATSAEERERHGTSRSGVLNNSHCFCDLATLLAQAHTLEWRSSGFDEPGVRLDPHRETIETAELFNELRMGRHTR